jgi:hypothetical protein
VPCIILFLISINSARRCILKCDDPYLQKTNCYCLAQSCEAADMLMMILFSYTIKSLQHCRGVEQPQVLHRESSAQQHPPQLLLAFIVYFCRVCVCVARRRRSSSSSSSSTSSSSLAAQFSCYILLADFFASVSFPEKASSLLLLA